MTMRPEHKPDWRLIVAVNDDITFDAAGQKDLRATVISMRGHHVRVDTGFTQHDVHRSEIKSVIRKCAGRKPQKKE